MSHHCWIVLAAVRLLAFVLSEIPGLFARVNHLVLGPQSELAWAESPIVVMEFHMAEDSGESHGFLLAVITHEVRQRKLVFQKGASFGFPLKTSTANLPSVY